MKNQAILLDILREPKFQKSLHKPFRERLFHRSVERSPCHHHPHALSFCLSVSPHKHSQNFNLHYPCAASVQVSSRQSKLVVRSKQGKRTLNPQRAPLQQRHHVLPTLRGFMLNFRNWPNPTCALFLLPTQGAAREKRSGWKDRAAVKSATLLKVTEMNVKGSKRAAVFLRAGRRRGS